MNFHTKIFKFIALAVLALGAVAPRLSAQILVDVDYPTNNVAYSGTQTWGGWAMDKTAGVFSVTISVDNAVYVQAYYGVNRQDACDAVGNWPGCPDVGYDYTFNTRSFSNGSHTLTVTATTVDSRQSSVSMTIIISNNSGASNSGCPSGSPSSCLDPVPPTYLSGSWIETDGASEWTLTANNGSPGSSGSVSGSVLVFPPDPDCPVVTYSASGSFSPTNISSGTAGYAPFTWVAVSPTPSSTCSGYTPVGEVTFRGNVYNRGNDTGGGTWTNEFGVNGTLSIETNLILTPTSEILASGVWGQGIYSTQLNTSQGLADSTSYDPGDPHQNEFQGRQVYESPGIGNVTDGCYDSAFETFGTAPPVPKFAIQGSVWNVGDSSTFPLFSGDSWAYDSIGWNTTQVAWYRTHIPNSLPCTATVPQSMYIVDLVTGDDFFASHTLQITIGSNYVTVQKDTLSQTTYQ